MIGQAQAVQAAQTVQAVQATDEGDGNDGGPVVSLQLEMGSSKDAVASSRTGAANSYGWAVHSLMHADGYVHIHTADILP